MATVSISKAAKLADVSRSTLYNSYINKGVISVSRDDKGKPCIDTSELIRVFGVLSPDSPDTTQDSLKTQGDTVKPDTSDSQEYTLLLAENERLKQEIEEAKKREKEQVNRERWYRSQIESLTDTIKLLEPPPKQAPKKRRWSWWF